VIADKPQEDGRRQAREGVAAPLNFTTKLTKATKRFQALRARALVIFVIFVVGMTAPVGLARR
jgi:hypothetical protein